MIEAEDIPSRVRILPLRNAVLFPTGVLPLAIGRKKSIRLLKDAVKDDQLLVLLQEELRQLALQVLDRIPELPPEASDLFRSIGHPGHLADLVAANVDIPLDEKLSVLETPGLPERLELVIRLLQARRLVLDLSSSGRRLAGADEPSPFARLVPVPRHLLLRAGVCARHAREARASGDGSRMRDALERVLALLEELDARSGEPPP